MHMPIGRDEHDVLIGGIDPAADRAARDSRRGTGVGGQVVMRPMPRAERVIELMHMPIGRDEHDVLIGGRDDAHLDGL